MVILGLVGFGAQMVDGSLGMGFGATSTTLLLAVGTNPALASATVNLTQIGTTLASGASHWRFGNVDWDVVRRIVIPGGVGAFAGALFLTSLSIGAAVPLMAGILVALGAYILVRFTVAALPLDKLGMPLRSRFLTPLGFVAGFVNGTAGGGWGPVNTSALLATGRLEPRKIVGSVGTSEFVVASCASLGFLLGLGLGGIDFTWVAAMLIGGVIAAPIAAWLVKRIPARVLGSAVGGLIVLLNARTLMSEHGFGLAGGVRATVVVTVLVVWGTAVAYAIKAHREATARESVSAPSGPA
nr:sulfite exporter TauE/SafE family protein [Phytoactinopolyspora alkaliphila]